MKMWKDYDDNSNKNDGNGRIMIRKASWAFDSSEIKKKTGLTELINIVIYSQQTYSFSVKYTTKWPL